MSNLIGSKKNSFMFILEEYFFKSLGREFQTFGPVDSIDRILAFVLANKMCKSFDDLA